MTKEKDRSELDRALVNGFGTIKTLLGIGEASKGGIVIKALDPIIKRLSSYSDNVRNSAGAPLQMDGGHASLESVLEHLQETTSPCIRRFSLMEFGVAENTSAAEFFLTCYVWLCLQRLQIRRNDPGGCIVQGGPAKAHLPRRPGEATHPVEQAESARNPRRPLVRF